MTGKITRDYREAIDDEISGQKKVKNVCTGAYTNGPLFQGSFINERKKRFLDIQPPFISINLSCYVIPVLIEARNRNSTSTQRLYPQPFQDGIFARLFFHGFGGDIFPPCPFQ